VQVSARAASASPAGTTSIPNVGQAERDFLAPLSAAEAAQFKKTLRALLGRV